MRQDIAAPYLFDGAFSTYYKTLYGGGEPADFACLSHPENVRRVHRDYIDAGAQAIKTNTFGVNAVLVPDSDIRKELVLAGWEIACRAADGRADVFADIGFIAADDELSAPMYLELAEWFLQCGCTRFLFETQEAFAPLVPALELIKSRCAGATVIVSFAVAQDGYSGQGLSVHTLTRAAAESGLADAAGINCVCGPQHSLDIISRLTLKEGVMLTVMPNAGYPALLMGRSDFSHSADYYAQKMGEIYLSGAQILGGCCGTEPSHIRQTAQTLKSLQAEGNRPALGRKNQSAFSAKPNAFVQKLSTYSPVFAVELNPPKNADFSFISEAARRAKVHGADIITVTDSPMSRPHADCLLTSAKIKREAGIDVLPHLSCRDRNQIAIKGGLLSLAGEGIDNLLIITGDPIVQTDSAGFKGVFSFNSVRLLRYISSLNAELFASRPFAPGAALNTGAKNFDEELKKAVRKTEAGAQFFLTQPVFTEREAGNLMRARRELGTPVLGGIMPVTSYKSAVYLTNEVHGITVPEELSDRLKDASPERARGIALEFCKGISDMLRGNVEGYYLLTPGKNIEIICSLMKYIKSGCSA